MKAVKSNFLSPPLPYRARKLFPGTASKLCQCSGDQPRIALSRTLAALFLLVGIVSSLAARGHAESAESLSLVHKIYVDSLGTDSSAVAVRNDLIRDLQKSRQLKVVPKPAEADAVMKGTARIWTVGRVSLSLRSHSPVEPILEGYVSVEVVGKDNQTLWSYLVTPSKFPWSGVTDDLAKQLASRLLNAVNGNTHQEFADSSTAASARASLIGAGATFPAPLYQEWFGVFQQTHPAAHISYDPGRIG